jgi:2-keto-4-pentenoate hydratase/2-oxohepta-3-ene-1,7-dioic acid hydratase in catechol pathway
MRIVRVKDETGEIVHASEQADGTLLKLEGNPLFDMPHLTDQKVTVVKYLAPIEPAAILCIGLNYRKHAEEGGSPIPEWPVLFMKNPNAATGHGQPIRLPAVCREEVDYEAELAVIIGKTARNVSREDALDHVAGYCCANDVSARIWQLQLGGSQWNRGKSFDTFCPLGPVMVTADDIPNPNALAIRSELNGEEMQASNTADMIFDVPELIHFLSQDTTLLPGTVIITGTPSGIGWARDPKVTLKKGDAITVEIEKIGRLTNPVV